MIAALPAPKDGLERASKGSLSSATASDSTAPAPMASKVGLHPTQSGHVSEAEAAAALAAMESGAHPVDLNEPTRKEWWNIFFLVWVTVTREGVESVVLLGGVGVNVKPQVRCCLHPPQRVAWLHCCVSGRATCKGKQACTPSLSSAHSYAVGPGRRGERMHP